MFPFAGVPCAGKCVIQGFHAQVLNTGALPMAERVVHWRPPRDHLGRARKPVQVRLVPVAPGEPTRETAGSTAMALPVEASVLAAARVGDELRLTEYRGRKRSLRLVREDTNGAFVAEGNQGVYVEACTPVALLRQSRE